MQEVEQCREQLPRMSCKAGPVNDSKKRVIRRIAGPGVQTGNLPGNSLNIRVICNAAVSGSLIYNPHSKPP